MTDFLLNFVLELWEILLALSPSLLMGLAIAGLIHVYLPRGLIRRNLAAPNLGSVARASLIGVPMTLCSCGVIPTAMGLRKEGASPGATTAFMISTPQVGADSVLVSAAFLGWPFAIFKVIAAFVTGLIGGSLVNRLTGGKQEMQLPVASGTARESRNGGLTGALRYALFDLLAAIDLWLIAGIVAAALVTLLAPDLFAGQSWTQGVLGMLAVLAISLPLYVCTTASVPIAASLIAAGMPAGSALVFLMAGPATNLATFGAVHRTLGTRVLLIYLGTVIVMSLSMGMLFDWLLTADAAPTAAHEHGHGWVSIISALILLAALGYLSFKRLRARLAASAPIEPGESTVEVAGMSCQHCVANVKRTLEGLDGIEQAEPELSSGLVRLRAEHVDRKAMAAALEGAGFQLRPTSQS